MTKQWTRLTDSQWDQVKDYLPIKHKPTHSPAGTSIVALGEGALPTAKAPSPDDLYYQLHHHSVGD